MGECEALTIVRVKGLDLEGDLFRLGEQSDASICHRAVHIHEEQFDLFRALLQSGRDFAKTRHEAPTTGFVLQSVTEPVGQVYVRLTFSPVKFPASACESKVSYVSRPR